MDDGDLHDVDMESEGNGALDIYDDALVIAYLQANEIPIILTPKERDRVVHRAKWFKWEGNSLLSFQHKLYMLDRLYSILLVILECNHYL